MSRLLPAVTMCSMWRDDAFRGLPRRATHLLAKAGDYANLSFIWVVGDGKENSLTAVTLERAARRAGMANRVRVIVSDTGVEGDDPITRLRRLSLTANVWLDNLADTCDYVLIHESDLLSPPDLVSRFVAHVLVGREVVAGWPTLTVDGKTFFYDTWAYRSHGIAFSNYFPYHTAYRSDAPFRVDSVGSVWMFPARFARGDAAIRCHHRAVLDLCDGLRAHGQAIWVDPTIEIVQPQEYWRPAIPAPF